MAKKVSAQELIPTLDIGFGYPYRNLVLVVDYTKIDLPMQLLPDATDAKIRVEFQLKNMNHQRIRELLAIPNLHFASEVINGFCNQSKYVPRSGSKYSAS